MGNLLFLAEKFICQMYRLLLHITADETLLKFIFYHAQLKNILYSKYLLKQYVRLYIYHGFVLGFYIMLYCQLSVVTL